ncbi:YaaC family protein [Flavobacterium suzhouense]|uniref:YaaC family protein n=1 Tax=Flavobacterium suzhouense TaxID=1529638 RepID=A0ABW5NTC8_9FLAO
MPTKKITIDSKSVFVHKAILKPDFNKKSVLVDNPWEYVELWIKRQTNSNNALFYWQQAHGFYQATKQLPKTSSPLTAYYCFLNATKALLEIRNINYMDRHGVTGNSTGIASLSNENIKFQANGILAELSRLLGEPVNGEIFTFKKLIYNLSYIHRAYKLTYSSDPELFYPISDPHFVKIQNQNYAYFQAEITSEFYKNKNTINKLPSTLERDLGNPDKWIIRKKKRFKWVNGAANKANNLSRLTNYHKAVRTDIHFIYGSIDLWYFKRTGFGNAINKNSLTITFALMHRLSELSRYNPVRLKKHFDCQHNWLLSEFINLAPTQFIYTIACEITGQEFKIPGVRK